MSEKGGQEKATITGIPKQPVESLETGVRWGLHAKKVAAGAAMASAAFTSGGVAGMMLAPVDVMVGPHEATAQLTVDNRVHFDLGPIGNVSLPSPFQVGPLEVGGIKLTIDEIPNGDGAPLGATEVQAYQRFFTQAGRESDAKGVQDALVERGVQSGAVSVVGGALLWFGLGSRGRRAIAEVGHSRRLRVAGCIALSGALLYGSQPVTVETAPPKTSTILEAAGLHDVRVEGKVLEALVHQYGPGILKYVNEVDTYYGEIEANVIKTYDATVAAERANPTTLREMIDSGQTQEVIWVSDNHCNTETAAIVAAFANKIDPAFILDSGDQTLGGTRAERYCVSVIPSSTEVPIVVSLGNHDDAQVTAAQDRELGYHVLAGKVTEIAGFKILGDSDVMRSEFNVPFHQDGYETIESQGERLAAEACLSGGVDIVAMHEPAAGLPSAEIGCASLVVSGHTHTFTAPVAVTSESGNVSYVMTNGTTGGAAPNKMTFVSKLGKDATIAILVFDAETKEPLGYRTIVMHPDTSVSVGELIPMQTR